MVLQFGSLFLEYLLTFLGIGLEPALENSVGIVSRLLQSLRRSAQVPCPVLLDRTSTHC